MGGKAGVTGPVRGHLEYQVNMRPSQGTLNGQRDIRPAQGHLEWPDKCDGRDSVSMRSMSDVERRWWGAGEGLSPEGHCRRPGEDSI